MSLEYKNHNNEIRLHLVVTRDRQRRHGDITRQVVEQKSTKYRRRSGDVDRLQHVR